MWVTCLYLAGLRGVLASFVRFETVCHRSIQILMEASCSWPILLVACEWYRGAVV